MFPHWPTSHAESTPPDVMYTPLCTVFPVCSTTNISSLRHKTDKPSPTNLQHNDYHLDLIPPCITPHQCNIFTEGSTMDNLYGKPNRESTAPNVGVDSLTRHLYTRATQNFITLRLPFHLLFLRNASATCNAGMEHQTCNG